MIKTLEFLCSRRPELEIKESFIQQMQDFEHRLNSLGIGPLSFTFNECSFRDANGQRVAHVKVSAEVEAEEAILRNTFINAKMMSSAAPQKQTQMVTRKEPILIKWVDQV